MKNIFRQHITLILVVLATAFSGVLPVSAAGNVVKLYVTPASQLVATGNSVTVQVKLSKDTTTKVDYASADMRFSSNILEVSSVTRAGSYFTNNNGPTTSFNNTNGTLAISGSGATLPTAADVLLATVTFRVKAAGTGTLSFSTASVAGDQLGSGNVKNALTSTSGSTLTGVAPAASPTKTTTVTPPASTPSSSPTTTTNTNATPPDATTSNTTPQVNENETVQAPVQAEDVKANSTNRGSLFGLELWQLVAGSVLALGVVVGSVLAALKILARKHDDVLAPIAESEAKEETIKQMPDEHSFFASTPIPDPLAQVQSVSDNEQPLDIAPAVADQTGSDTPTVVAGVAIEPLDPNMPSPLTDVIAPVEPVAGVTQPDISTTPQVATVEPVQTPVYEVQSQSAAEVPSVVPSITPTQPVTYNAVPQNEFPDMFEVGEARLHAEGLDNQLKVSKS